MQEREPRLFSLKPLTLIAAGTLFSLSTGLVPQAVAWSSDKPRTLSIQGSKQSHVRGTTASLAPVTIRNVRATT
ncbi:MAG TPA: hypothetical protein PLO50_04375, partial [Nitrospira sp.]|nr:hypothetical protein [Nitrospira sp.]